MAESAGITSADLMRAAEFSLLRQIADKAERELDSEELQMVAEAYAAVRANPAPPKLS